MISPIGCVRQREKNRPIVHMSAPRDINKGISLNETLVKELKTVKYVSFREIINFIVSLGRDAYIWTCDLKDAYLNVPIHKDDWQFMGFRWFGYIFYFTCFPFGLSSAPKIFTDFADAIEWITVDNDIEIYLIKLIYHSRG